MDLQSLIHSDSSNGTVDLPPGEFFGQVTVDRPVTITGKGMVSWVGSKESPVIRISSPGVKLVNLVVEATAGPTDVAIEAAPGTDPVLEHILVRGLVVGVPDENLTPMAAEHDTDSLPISFLPPPPMSVSTPDRVPWSAAPDAPPQNPAPPAEPRPGFLHQKEWWKVGAILLVVWILAGAVILLALTGGTREKAKAIQRQRQAERIANLEKQRIERERKEREQEAERLRAEERRKAEEKEKREQEERAERLRAEEKRKAEEKEKKDQEERAARARAFDLEDRDKRTREWVRHREGAARVRERVRNQLKSLSKFRERDKHKMTSGYVAFAGNVQDGNSGWAKRSSVDEATRGAFEACEKNGGGCEELFMLKVFNDTSKTITVYLYHPWEPHLEPSNSLFNWTFAPGEEQYLGIDDARLLVSKRLYLHATSSGVKWGPFPIELYNYNTTTGSDGKSLRVKLVFKSNK